MPNYADKKEKSKAPKPKKEKKQRDRDDKPKRKRESEDRSGTKRSKTEGNGEQRWKTLVHSGVMFPPEYQAHGVKMLYDGVPVDLTPEQEEVATFFAVMKETDYMKKEIFLRNFWEGFQEVLGPNHVIKSLEK